MSTLSMPRPLIIDCDPGQDDAINILLTLASTNDFDLLGITTVAGNVPLEMTQKNARIICELAGRSDIPVYAGCPRPMVLAPRTAHQVHGPSGLDGMELFEPTAPLRPEHAVDFLVDSLRAAEEGSVTLAPTGPLTNIAMALVKAPDIASKIREIVLMGGAMREGGNFSPSAEFNILVDPHAAHVVMTCGRPVTAIGLDATHQALCTPERLAPLKADGGRIAEAAYGMLTFFNRHDTAKYGSEGAPLHDPCTVAYLLAPEIFEAKRCHIAIETASPLTMGHMAVDFWGVMGEEPNATWVYGLDADAFFDLIVTRVLTL